MEHCPLLQRRVLTPGSAKHLLFELSLHAGSLLQVVKAFIVLNSEFSCRDPDELTKELQQHVKLVTAPYKYPRKVRPLDSHVLPPLLRDGDMVFLL